MESKKSMRWSRGVGILALLLAWLLIWPACMSFQRDGWDPKWGEDESEGDDFKEEEKPPAENKTAAKTQDPDAELEKAVEQVESELEADAKKQPAPAAQPPDDDPGIVAIPPPIEGIPTPELVPDAEGDGGSGALTPEEPPAVDDSKKKDDGGENEKEEDLDDDGAA